jgi:hypothetical protein
MSQKVSALSDFEHRVWTQYILSADDFGVMPASAFVLQADNAALATRPTRKVQAALETVISVGLVLVFTHQGTRYVWQKDWQDWQEIRWPRRTSRPLPIVQGEATAATQKLFGEHSKKLTQNFGETTEKLTSRAQARNPNPNPDPNPNSHSEDLVSESEEIPTGDPPVWNPNGRGMARQSALVGDHRRCSPEASEACGRGLCVPAFLVGQWRANLRQITEDEREIDAGIRQLVREELARHAGVIGDDPLKFWRAAWEAKHGSQRPATGSTHSRTGDTVQAGKASLEKRVGRILAEEGESDGESRRKIEG